MYVCFYVRLCVSCRRTALSLCFYIPALLLLASVWGPISQLCWRSINPDRSIVPPLFTDSDQRLALRYHFQLEKHPWAGMEVDLKWLQQLTGGTSGFSVFVSKRDHVQIQQERQMLSYESNFLNPVQGFIRPKLIPACIEQEAGYIMDRCITMHMYWESHHQQ